MQKVYDKATWKEEFEKTMRGSVCVHVGFVIERPELRIRGLSGSDVIQANLAELKSVWKSTLEVV